MRSEFVYYSPMTDPTPLEDLAREYLEDRRAAGVSLKTLHSDLQPRLERVFLPWCRAHGITEADQLDQAVINRWSIHLREKGGAKGPLATASIASYTKSMNSFVNWVRKSGKGSPTGRAHKPKLAEHDVEVLTDAEVKALVKAAGPRDALLIQTLADSGVRVSELVGLRVADLVEQDVMLLNGQRQHQYCLRVLGKADPLHGPKERIVPIPQDLYRRLRALARSRPASDSDRLWISSRRDPRTGAYEPLGASGVEQLLAWLGRQVLGRRVHPHLFRHTYISKLVRAGVDSTIIRRYVGHTSTQLIDRVYGHLRPQDAAGIVLSILRAKSD